MDENATQRIIKKVNWRLLPIAMLLFFLSLLDRTNISFAALEMNKDIGLSVAQYGIAASIFFLGYLIFEIPSNFVLERIGARVWLARIMISWGIVVVAMTFVQGAISLYVTRFLLGVAEAGLLPGLLFYLALWLPKAQRGAAYATLLSTTAVAYALGGPFTTWLMGLSVFGLKGWQTMYVVQGLLTVVVGLMVPFLLPNYVKDAAWLDPTERHWLQTRLDQEEAAKRDIGATTLRRGFLDRRVLLATATCFFLVCANFGTVLFLPQILRSSFTASTNMQISLLSSLAFAIGGIAGILCGVSSDRAGDRRWHIAACTLVGACGYACAGIAASPTLQFIGICVGVVGVWSIFGVFWAHAGDLLGGSAAAGGFAFVNSVGSIGGVVAPNILAYAREQASSFSGSLFALSIFALVTALLAAIFLRNVVIPLAGPNEMIR